MSNWLKVDASAGDAYVKHTFGTAFTLGNGFTVEADTWFTSASHSALVGGGTPAFGAYLFDEFRSSANTGTFSAPFLDMPNSVTVDVGNSASPNAPAGSVSLDMSQHLAVQAVWNSGASAFDVTVQLNTVTIDTYQNTFGDTTSTTFNHLSLGAMSPAGVAGEIYYLTNFVFKDSTGATVFSDAFASGDLSGWSSSVGTAKLSVITTNPDGTTSGGVGAGLQASRVF